MGRASRRAHLARAAALASALLLSLGGLAEPAPARAAVWGRSFVLAGPFSLDLLPAQLAFSPGGQPAAALTLQDADAPADSKALVVAGRPRRIPGALEALALTFSGRSIELLTGTSRAGAPCCRSVQAVAVTGRRVAAAQTLVTGVGGGALGSLVELPGGSLMAAIGSPTGVWVAQSRPGGPFGAAARLTPRSAAPQTLATDALPGGGSIVAWTASPSQPGPAPRTIFVATGSAQQAPSRPRAAIRVPAGHEVDEIGVAHGSSAPTLGWIESWFDSAGNFQSAAVVADLRGGVVRRALEVVGNPASGLSVAGDASGDELLAWKTCDASGACTVVALTRAARRGGWRVLTLGSIDASQSPVAAVAPDGQAVVGWIDGGDVLAAGGASGSSAFASPRTISSTGLASDLTIEFGPRGRGLAAWTDGTVSPALMAAAVRG